ncbi:plasmid mobilization relaxosome protein MobC [Phenylobacterium sp.]|uniref:plasmid mobilization relaxosome protein MobC n=1 Tax=Phenylobacterium sp. TaxID=1871053 RepID=UPI00356669AA
MAIFNVRLDDDLAARFDAWASARGGRSVALRQLMVGAVGASREMASHAAHAPFPVKLTVRLSAADVIGLDVAAAETGLTRNAWAAAVLRRRLRDRPTFAGSDAVSLIAIQTELRRIGVNVNQIARALNTAVMEGRVLDLELGALDDLRREMRGHLRGLQSAFAGNLAYWAGEP